MYKSGVRSLCVDWGCANYRKFNGQSSPRDPLVPTPQNTMSTCTSAMLSILGECDNLTGCSQLIHSHMFCGKKKHSTRSVNLHVQKLFPFLSSVPYTFSMYYYIQKGNRGAISKSTMWIVLCVSSPLKVR